MMMKAIKEKLIDFLMWRISMTTKERKTIERIGFLKGKIDGITTYATWKDGDGEQLVGDLRTPLEKVLKPLRYELEELLGERK